MQEGKTFNLNERRLYWRNVCLYDCELTGGFIFMRSNRNSISLKGSTSLFLVGIYLLYMLAYVLVITFIHRNNYNTRNNSGNRQQNLHAIVNSFWLFFFLKHNKDTLISKPMNCFKTLVTRLH